VLIHLCVYSRTRDCECAKPYMCAHKKKKKKKKKERDRGLRKKEPLRRQLETSSVWFPPEYSCIHMCLTLLLFLLVSVFLALFFFLFSCSLSEETVTAGCTYSLLR